MYRLLFLLFLAVLFISPIVDAYQDSFCPCTVLFHDLNDEDSPVGIDELNLNDTLKSQHALKSASDKKPVDQTPASPKGYPSECITKSQISANDIKSSQCCPPLSSDPSPPVA
jgi:hypothetical protein